MNWPIEFEVFNQWLVPYPNSLLIRTVGDKNNNWDQTDQTIPRYDVI